MRWIVAFATAACLMVGLAAHPAPRGTLERSATLGTAPSSAAHVGQRRDGSRADARLGVFVLPRSVEAPEPPRTYASTTCARRAQLVDVARAEPRSRGPPPG